MNIDNPAVQAIYESDLSQTELSKKFRVSVAHLNRVVNRKSKSKPLEHRIAKFVEKEIHQIFPDRKKRGPRTSASIGRRATSMAG